MSIRAVTGGPFIKASSREKFTSRILWSKPPRGALRSRCSIVDSAAALRSYLWPHLDKQITSPLDTPEFLVAQARHAPPGVSAGFLIVHELDEPVAATPIFSAYMSLDDGMVSDRVRAICRYKDIKKRLRAWGAPFSPLGIKALHLGGMYHFVNRFFTASGSTQEFADAALNRALFRGLRAAQWSTLSPGLAAFRFAKTDENLQVFKNWGLSVMANWPDTAIDLGSMRANQTVLKQRPLSLETYPEFLGSSSRSNFRRNIRTKIAARTDYSVEVIPTEQALGLLPDMAAALRCQFSRSLTQWLPMTEPLLAEIIRLEETSTLVAWHHPSASQKALAGFNLILNKPGTSINFRLGILDEHAYRGSEGAESPLIWHRLLLRNLEQAIADDAATVHCGPTGFAGKRQFGYQKVKTVLAANLPMYLSMINSPTPQSSANFEDEKLLEQY